MAYLVLARKYRPERFADMVGQEHVTQTLQNAIANGRVHHAYLLCGVRGLGKTTAARILAKCLVCEQGPAREPCNACEQCRAISEGRSVDVVEIDGASNNSVDNIRNLREQVHYLPQFARRKIYIIDEVHMLTSSAFNALLKTLEEPPEHVTFIFATTDPHKVLPTIMSRVSRLDLRRVPGNLLVAHLASVLEREGVKMEEEGLRVVSQCSEGSVRDALTLLDKVLAFAADPTLVRADEVRTILGQPDRLAVADLVQAILDRHPGQVLERFDAIARSSNDLLRLGIQVLQHLRDLAVVRAVPDPEHQRGALLDVSEAAFERLQAQAAATSPTVVAQLFDRFTHVVEQLEDSRVPRLLLEMGLLDLAHAEPLAPMSELVERLAAIGGGNGGARGGGARGPGGAAPSRGGGAARERGAAGVRAAPSPAPSAADRHAEPRAEPRTEPRAEPRAEPRPGQRPEPREPQQTARARPEPTPAPRPQAQTRPAAARPSAASPEPAPAPAPSSSLAATLWKMVGQSPSAEPAPVSPTPASAASAEGFELRAEEDPPAPVAHLEAPTPDAGCPSSRCTPRDVIPWQRLEPFAAWESLLDRIRDEDDFLFAVLGSLGLSRLDEHRVVLAGTGGNFARDQLAHDPELRVRLEGFMRDYFGVAPKVELLDAAPALPHLPSLELVERQRKRDFQERLEEEAQSNPKIQALLREFGGTLRVVRPASDGSSGDSGATLGS